MNNWNKNKHWNQIRTQTPVNYAYATQDMVKISLRDKATQQKIMCEQKSDSKYNKYNKVFRSD